MRILFITPYVPSRIRVRPYNWLKSLVHLGHAIHLVSLRPPEDRWASLGELRDLCEAVDVFDVSRARTLRNVLAAAAGRDPLQAAYSRHPDAERRLASLARSGRFEVAHIEHMRAARLAWALEGLPRVFDAVDSIANLFAQASRHAPTFSQRLVARLELARTQSFEARAVIEFERTVVTSELDRQALVAAVPAACHAKVVVVANGVDLDYFRPGAGPSGDHTILFTGKMSYHANAAAALHLVRDIMPIVWRSLPEARLIIAGKDPSKIISALAKDPRIVITGFVEDLRPFFHAATVLAAPLVYSTGIQNKVLEAMASGLPVVTTEQVARGLSAVSGQDLLVAVSDQDAADALIQVCRDARLRRNLARASRSYAEGHHDWLAKSRALCAVYESALADRTGGAGSMRPVASA